MPRNKIHCFYVRRKETSLTWRKWIFSVFNLENLAKSKIKYNEKGFRIFGFTILWIK
jgi:hypothetical protein